MERNNGGGELRPRPEQREQLVINSIVIPADRAQPLAQSELIAASLDDYQQLVGGLIQKVPLEQPPASMYLNEEGKLHSLPINNRATMLLWMHNRAFRYEDIIVGDAFLVGRADKRGVDTNVPDEYVERLFEARQFRVEVQARGDSGWHQDGAYLDQWTSAYAYALAVVEQRDQVADVRIVPEA